MNGDTTIECVTCKFRRTPVELLLFKVGKILFKKMKCENCGGKGEGWTVVIASKHVMQK